MNNKKRAIIILAGGIKKDSDGVWHTSSYEDSGDQYGVDGCRLRVVAASFLFRDDANALVIASGGVGQLKNVKGAPPSSSVIARELISLGVPAEAIFEDDKSGNTFEQLLNLQNVIGRSEIEKVIIVSNNWHLPRIQAMIEYHSDLKELKSLLDLKRIELCDADEILLNQDPKHWRPIIEQAILSRAYRGRLLLEQKGVEDIKAGRYKF